MHAEWRMTFMRTRVLVIADRYSESNYHVVAFCVQVVANILLRKVKMYQLDTNIAYRVNCM